MTQTNDERLTPAYWSGNDILDEALFMQAPREPGVYLSYNTLLDARTDLMRNLGQVVAGNATEVRYDAGKDLTMLGEGSLVAIDQEYLDLTRQKNDERSALGRPFHTNPGTDNLAMTRPYHGYWLSGQHKVPTPKVGSLSVPFLDGALKYTRVLSWGIAISQDNANYIQPFWFSNTHVLPDGSIDTPPILRRDSALHGAALPLPVEIGKVRVNPRFERPTFTSDTLERVRSIDVVYPAQGAKQQDLARERRRKFLVPPVWFNPRSSEG